MKVPEKLYLHPTASGNVGASWLSFPLTDKDIEYIRKDTVLEKVVNFLEILGYAYTITDNITKSLYDNTQLIEDFKKYMEE